MVLVSDEGVRIIGRELPKGARYVPICAAVSSVNWVPSVLVRAGLGEFRDVAEDVSEAGCEQGDVALVLQKS